MFGLRHALLGLIGLLTACGGGTLPPQPGVPGSTGGPAAPGLPGAGASPIGDAADSAEVSAERTRQTALVLRANVESARRLHAVAETLLHQGADLCTTLAPRTGLTLWGATPRTSEAGRSVLAQYGLGDGVYVLAAGRATPAAAAGLRFSDEIVTIDGAPVSAGGDTLRLAIGRLNAATARNAPFTVSYRRGGRAATATLRPLMACDYAVSLLPRTDINAFANGRAFGATRGMVELMARDDELALILGHEIAHNSRNHIARARQDVRNLGAGAAPYLQEYEREADYVGLYMMARAGYNPALAPDTMRRLALTNPGSIGYSRTHPPTPERVVAIEGAVREIAAKRAQRLPLVPGR